ncbi:MAG: hypothetical protein ACRDM7_12630 [Thermoleophilaceae bacterium]
MNRVLAAVAVALLVVLAAAGVLAQESEEAEQAAPALAPGAPAERVERRVEEVARDVERVRELEFDRLPRVRSVSPSEVRRAGMSELDRYVPRRRQAMVLGEGRLTGAAGGAADRALRGPPLGDA